MTNTNFDMLDAIFHPRSIALVGITKSNPSHWTRTFLYGLTEFKFPGPIYLVNPKGGEIEGLKVYPSLKDVPGQVDLVIGLVAAETAPEIVAEAAKKGAKAIHFCTAGFSETSEEAGKRLEEELKKVIQRSGVRVIGPNCMGIYCPESGLSFSPVFPRESGEVGFISQSGGNAIYVGRQAGLRGVRFSKIISYGNACDLDESDFLEYMTDDPETRIIALYLEGVKDGKRFRRALEKATRTKTVVLLKGGVTEAGARAVAGHTASLAGSRSTWEALCKQTRAIMVNSLDEMIDVLVTLCFLPVPRGRNVVLIGVGGGASVLFTDEFERHGLKLPRIPDEIVAQLREYTHAAGNILSNPVDYSQAMMFPEKVRKTVDILTRWDGTDILVKFMRSGQWARPGDIWKNPAMYGGFLREGDLRAKPTAIIIEPSIEPQEAGPIYACIQDFAASRLPVYFSFTSAAVALDLVLKHYGK